MLAAPSRGSSCLGLWSKVTFLARVRAVRRGTVRYSADGFPAQHSTAQYGTHIPGTGWGGLCHVSCVQSRHTPKQQRPWGAAAGDYRCSLAPGTWHLCGVVCRQCPWLEMAQARPWHSRSAVSRDHPWWCKAAGFITRDHGAMATPAPATRSRLHCRGCSRYCRHCRYY